MSAAAPTESAVWMPKELTFVYMGFTAHYSCDGLLDKMRRVLLMLGARADLDVTRYGCSSSYGTPDPFPGVRIKMSVLAPAPNGAPPAAPVPAQWKSVEVRLNKDPLYEAGDCELIEQIRQKILPQFTTRKVEFNSNCVPNQLSAGGTWLRAEVLTADQKDDKALASK
ncbi:MAG TPA: hypothetical protein VMT09_09985 [Steroidobacteraceae bacterium]|nr:hypothetical protein [Steroidobacteraceae bacterium]